MRRSRQPIALALGLVLSSGTLFERGARTAESGHLEAKRNANEVVTRSSPGTLGHIPLSFSVDQGQADWPARVSSRGPGYNFELKPAEAILTLSETSSRKSAQESAVASVVSFKMTFVGGNRGARVEGLEELPGKSNYLIGKDPKKWRTNVPTYGRVKYREVYPGVDVVYYGNQQHLEYDLVVAAGADPRVIKVSFEGAEKIELAPNGDLLVSAAGTKLRQLKPTVFQDLEGENRRSVECRYLLKGNGVTFALGPYDTSKPLVIDPLLVYSTTGIGGSSIALDSDGNIYLTGGPSIEGTPGAYQTLPRSSSDAFVAKLNASGTSLIYATNLGGSDSDWGHALEVDTAGNVYLVGTTRSTDFPISTGAVQSRPGGGVCPTSTGIPNPCSDVFVAKLNASGSALTYSTYLGGSSWESPGGIKVDRAGFAYVTGTTWSSNFPVSEGVFQNTYAGDQDVFVTKVNPGGTDILYSTYLGTSAYQQAAGIALDASGEVYVAGNTSFGFLTTPGALNDPYGLLFVAKLNANGTALIYSSCFTLNQAFGDFDGLSGIAIDPGGSAYVSGTFSGPMYATPFALKLNSSGSAIVYDVALASWGFGGGLSVDAFGNAYVTGQTFGGLPVTGDAFQKEIGGGICFGHPCGDAFFAKLSPFGERLYSTYLGGNSSDSGSAVAIDSTGGILVTGYTDSSNFPTTSDSYKPSSFVGSFLVRVAPDVSSVSGAHYKIMPIAQSAIVASFGPNLATMTEAASSIPLPTVLGGSQVLITDSAGVNHSAPLYFVSPRQINYQVPSGVALGFALVTVTNGEGRLSTGLMTIASTAPALFTVNQTGAGAAAAVDAMTFTAAPFNATAPDGQPNIIALFGTGLGADATDVGSAVDVSPSVEVTIDGSRVATRFAGSAPGNVGLNQLNVVLPAGIKTGEHTVVVARNGIKSNLVTITTR